MHNLYFKKYYFIEKFKKNNIDKQDQNTIIIYRNYKKNYKINEIIFLRNYCRRKRLKFLISNNIKLSLKLNLDGAYLPSFNNSFLHLNFPFKKKFILIGSAHNLKEIRTKEKQGVKEIFISSIFKKNANYLGIYKFKLLSNISNKSVIALGGISIENIKLLKLTNSAGFAGITYFK